MLRLLRRSRLVPLLLLLAMPGVGGTLVQAGHHCGDKAPWSEHAPGHDAAQHAVHQHQADASPGSGAPGHPCECVGQCDRSAAGMVPLAAVPAIAVVPLETSGRLVAPGWSAPHTRPDRLLPPAIAPPLG